MCGPRQGTPQEVEDDKRPKGRRRTPRAVALGWRRWAKEARKKESAQRSDSAVMVPGRGETMAPAAPVILCGGGKHDDLVQSRPIGASLNLFSRSIRRCEAAQRATILWQNLEAWKQLDPLEVESASQLILIGGGRDTRKTSYGRRANHGSQWRAVDSHCISAQWNGRIHGARTVAGVLGIFVQSAGRRRAAPRFFPRSQSQRFIASLPIRLLPEIEAGA